MKKNLMSTVQVVEKMYIGFATKGILGSHVLQTGLEEMVVLIVLEKDQLLELMIWQQFILD